MTAETLTRPAPVEPTTPIKPSEAIRLGCLVHPVQAFHTGISGNTACVVGAAIVGFGDASRRDAWKQLDKLSCPVHGAKYRGGLTTIAHINDDHRWSRERIADWLESLGL